MDGGSEFDKQLVLLHLASNSAWALVYQVKQDFKWIAAPWLAALSVIAAFVFTHKLGYT